MTDPAIAMTEQLIDQAAELGMRLTRAAADRNGRLPADCAVHLGEALRAVRRAAVALDRAVNGMPPKSSSAR
jgi:hypothetical protein